MRFYPIPSGPFRCPGLVMAASLFVWLFTSCGQQALDTAHDGEMVHYTTTSRIRGFDPVKSGDVASARAISKIYEGLLQYAYLDRPYHVIPLLAEELPRVSNDGTVYLFKIRKGIYFQDDPCFTATHGRGRELVASDFVYAIKRVADIKNQGNGYWVFNDRIVGLDAWRERTADSKVPTDYAAPVIGLRALDSHTLQIRLKKPYPQLLWILTMHYSFAVPREAVEYYGDGFVNHPVGTGAYVLNSWRRNYRVEFIRNPKWIETGRIETYPFTGEPVDENRGLLLDAKKPVPFIDRIVEYVVQDPSTKWLMFLTGQFGASGVSRDNWDAVITENRALTGKLAAKNIRLSTAPTMLIRYIGFNMDDPVVGKNKALRQAMSCAVNSDQWIEFHHHRIIRPSGPIPPGVTGYTDMHSPFPFDLARARKLLVDAGYPNGKDPKTGKRLKLTLELGSAESAEMRQSVELFISFMDKIGVVIDPSYNNWPTFLDKMDRRQAQLFQLAWVADYPDAENFLQLFVGKNSSPGPNHANYSNPEFDELYENIREMHDSRERTLLCTQMSDIVIKDCPWIFLSIPLSYDLHYDWVFNHKHHDFPYGMEKFLKIGRTGRLDRSDVEVQQ